MKVSIREKELADLSLMQEVTEFVIGDRKPHAIGFQGDRLAGNHALRCLLHQIRHESGRNIALESLLADLSRLLRDLLERDFLVANFGQNSLGGEAASEIVAEEAARDEGDDHHHADDNQDAAQKNLL